MYKLTDNQGSLNDRIFNTEQEVEQYLKNFHAPDISFKQGIVYELHDLLDIGDWTLEKIEMPKDQIIARLQTIIKGIEGDRFTIENINQLIEDIK